MRSTLCSTPLKTALVVVPLSLYFRGPTIAEGGDKSMLSLGSVRSGHVNHRAELPQGFLTVYSTTDELDAWYFPRSLFAIYTIDGRLFKNVKSQHFADDQIPDVVALPVGSYLVVVRSENGYVRLPVVVKAGQQTLLDLDFREKVSVRRITQN
jgi:hypothetical protein